MLRTQEAKYNNDHSDYERDDQLHGVIACFHFGILRPRETGKQTFGKSLHDGKCQHGCGDLIHGFNEEAGA